MSKKIIPGLKLVYQTGGQRQEEDPSLPYKLEANLRPPEFMEIAFIGLYGGSEEIVVQGPTKESLELFIGENSLSTHPRLRWLKITGPNGIEFEIER